MSVALRKSTDSDSLPPEIGGIAAGRRHGRGAQSNRSGRYEPIGYEAADDGWESLAELEAFATEVQEVPARHIITRNESPDIGFDRSINPYRGCEHGCIYCFARPTHAFLGLSPGLDFETKPALAKPDPCEIRTARVDEGVERAEFDIVPVGRRQNFVQRALEVPAAFQIGVEPAFISVLPEILGLAQEKMVGPEARPEIYHQQVDRIEGDVVIAVAAFVGKIRLIDNLVYRTARG